MSIDLRLSEMSLTEKLRTMEALWDDLCHLGENKPPYWHEAVLNKRSE